MFYNDRIRKRDALFDVILLRSDIGVRHVPDGAVRIQNEAH